MKHVSPHRESWLAVVLFAASLIILWGNVAMAMSLNSPAFQQNDHIPSKYTCEGKDVSPPLAWEGVPNGAKSLVLIIDDPDAPDPRAPKMVWVHWIVYNIPPDTKSLPRTQARRGYRKAFYSGSTISKRATLPMRQCSRSLGTPAACWTQGYASATDGRSLCASTTTGRHSNDDKA